MAQYIDKDALVAEIEKRKSQFMSQADNFYSLGIEDKREHFAILASNMHSILSFLDTLEVKDPYEQRVQYDSIKAGIQAHAETYSFNIESILFNQLTKEQQKLWVKEIEQAVISGGEMGVELARDVRYKENLKVKKEDFEKEIKSYFKGFGKFASVGIDDCIDIAKYFFELGLKAKNK